MSENIDKNSFQKINELLSSSNYKKFFDSKDDKKDIDGNNDRNANDNSEQSSDLDKKVNLYLFVSFDICNSTQLKSKSENWFEIINKLLNKPFDCSDFWKFNGDEVIYRRDVRSLEHICDVIKEAYKHLDELNEEFNSIYNNVYVTSTIWIARTNEIIKPDTYNIKFSVNGYSEYIGKNIDEGFRLTKESSAQKVAIDPKIVYLILEAERIFSDRTFDTNVDFFNSVNEVKESERKKEVQDKLESIRDRIHFIGSTKCKGIWDNMPYPIFWYYETKKSNHRTEYNQFFNGFHLWDEMKKFKSIDDTFVNKLYEVFKVVGIIPQVEQITDLIRMSAPVPSSSETRANLYYMVACVHEKSGKVLIAKRSQSRQHLKGVWDFGNAKHQSVNMVATLKQEYKNIFNIDIDILQDKDREYNPVIQGYCTIYRNCLPHISLLLVAKINGTDELTEEQLLERINNNLADDYETVKFVKPEEIESLFVPLKMEEIRLDSRNDELANHNLGENRCIMYFKDSVIKALKAYNLYDGT